MSLADSTRCKTCQCRFGASNCVTFDNRGPNSPWYPEYILDADADQLAECSTNGFGVFLPTWLADPPACSVFLSIDQPIPFDTTQVLFFNREHYDTDAMHDNEENSSRITFNTSGVYVVTLNATWRKKTVSTGDLGIAIRKNSGEYLTSANGPYLDPDGVPAQSCTYEGFFEAGDYVEALAKQDGEDADGNGVTNAIVSERYSPIFAACFSRLEP